MSFEQLSLDEKILRALQEAGYSEATKIQSEAIPKILKGHDIRGSAQTGTGKTAAFLLPALQKLTQPSPKHGKGPRVLILAPTRELAMQIATQSEKYSKFLKQVKTVCVFGGVPIHKQMHKLKRPYDLLIATPGRLIDFMERNKIDFSRLEMLVLDEADRMLDMGFIGPVEDIVAATPSSRQTLLFSATLKGSVLKLSEKLLNSPIEIVIHANNEKHENITQKLHYADNLGHKNQILEHILITEEIENAIIFTSTKRHADLLVDELIDQGHLAASLHGDMSQRERNRTIGKLREGKIKILVATDVAARGLDVNSITHVINFDLPQSAEDYVHRIGRTGRAGAKGTALSFAAGRDRDMVKQIEKFTGQNLDIAVISGLEPSLKQDKASPSRRSKFNRKKGSFPRAKTPRDRRRRAVAT